MPPSRQVTRHTDLKPGDHISFYRDASPAFYLHHAIVVEVKPTELVIISFTNPSQDALFSSFASISSLSGNGGTKKSARILKEKISEREFKKETVYIYDYGKGESSNADTVIARAESVESGRIAWGEYSLASNNCEHFATWCKTGVRRSVQVETVATAATVAGVAGVGILAGLAYAFTRKNDSETTKERKY